MSTLAPAPPLAPPAAPRSADDEIDDARPVPPSAYMSEDEFEAWSLDVGSKGARCEWENGKVVVLGDANFEHNDILAWFMTILRVFVGHHKLGVVSFDNSMRLVDLSRRRLPDCYFVSEARRGIIGRTRINGPVDLAVEVVSPSSVTRDYVTKHREYERAGVPEYWIFDPQNESVSPFRLGEDGLYAVIPEVEGKVHSAAVPGFWLRPDDLWADPRPGELAVLAALGVK